jgi:hypothetical protein
MRRPSGRTFYFKGMWVNKMKLTNGIRVAVAAVVCAVALSACGGGGGVSGVTAAQKDSFKSAYTSGLDGTNTSTGLNSTELQDLFDKFYVDSGLNRSDVLSALNGEASALLAAATSAHSGVPKVTLSDVAVSNCVDAGSGAFTCSLSATVTNTDVDTTATTLISSLRMADGKLRLLGDQIATLN